MAPKTYNPVQSDDKFMDIIEYLFKQDVPVSGSTIAKDLDMPHGTVMSHLAAALKRKWVKQTGGHYEPGLIIPGMYSVYKMGLVTKIDTLQREYNSLEA